MAVLLVAPTFASSQEDKEEESPQTTSFLRAVAGVEPVTKDRRRGLLGDTCLLDVTKTYCPPAGPGKECVDIGRW